MNAGRLDEIEARANSGPDLFWDQERALVHLSVAEYGERVLDVTAAVSALRAVLALHVVSPAGEWCRADGSTHPCPTVRAITRHLGGTP